MNAKEFFNEWGMTILVPCVVIGTLVSIYCASKPLQVKVKIEPEADIGITENTPLNRAAYDVLVDKVRQHEDDTNRLLLKAQMMEKVLNKHEGWLEIVDGSIKDLRKKAK